MFASCSTNDKPVDAVNPFYVDVSISGAETSNDVTVLVYFRPADENGDGVAIPAGASVKLDDDLLQIGKAPITGTFYEITQPVDSFAGKHQVVFTNARGTTEKFEFDFTPFKITSYLPDSSTRTDFVFSFAGLPADGKLRVLVTDTSFLGEGINKVVRHSEGQIIISAQDLEPIMPGPIQFEFIQETEKPVNKNGQGGRVRSSFSISREMTLLD